MILKFQKKYKDGVFTGAVIATNQDNSFHHVLSYVGDVRDLFGHNVQLVHVNCDVVEEGEPYWLNGERRVNRKIDILEEVENPGW